MRRNKKGMSIIISTIIIVVMSITMAIAVSFWALGIGNSFTKFEKLEFVTGYTYDSIVYSGPGYPTGRLPSGAFEVFFQIKNTGTKTATINNIFLDGKPFNAESSLTPGGILSYQFGLLNQTIQSGQALGGQLYLPVGGLWSNGDYVSIVIETTAGNQYPYMVLISLGPG